jgi:hypothetical protein
MPASALKLRLSEFGAALGDGDGVAVGRAVGVGDGVGLGEAVGRKVGVGLGVGLDVGLGVGVGTRTGIGDGDGCFLDASRSASGCAPSEPLGEVSVLDGRHAVTHRDTTASNLMAPRCPIFRPLKSISRAKSENNESHATQG